MSLIGNISPLLIPPAEASSSPEILFSDNFNEPNGPPGGWTVYNSTANIANNVLMCSPSSKFKFSYPTDASFLGWQDLMMNFSFRMLGAINSTGYSQIAWRLQPQSTFYTLVIRQTGVFDIYSDVDSLWLSISNKTIPQDNNWHDISILTQGRHFFIWIDKEKDPRYAYVSDSNEPSLNPLPNWHPNGTIGFGSTGWATEYDNLTVTTIPSRYWIIDNFQVFKKFIYQNEPVHLCAEVSFPDALSSVKFTVASPASTVYTKTFDSAIGKNWFNATADFSTDFGRLDSYGRYNVTITGISSSNQISKNDYFYYLPTPLATFAAFADSHVSYLTVNTGAGPSYLADFVNLINSQEDFQTPNFVAGLGDITNEGYVQNMTYVKNTLDQLTTPYRVYGGNHDVLQEEGDNRGQQFVSVFGQNAINDSWTINGVSFIGFSTHMYNFDMEYTQTEYSGQFYDWLNATLAQNKDQPTILMSHFGLVEPRDAGTVQSYYTKNSTLKALVENYGNVELFLAGHAHVVAKQVSDGINYVFVPPLYEHMSFTYVAVYKDAIYGRVFDVPGYDPNLRPNWVTNCTDSTHLTMEDYNYGLDNERNFVIGNPTYPLPPTASPTPSPTTTPTWSYPTPTQTTAPIHTPSPTPTVSSQPLSQNSTTSPPPSPTFSIPEMNTVASCSVVLASSGAVVVWLYRQKPKMQKS